ncbi:MAG TPA: dolichyl-phosphate beta-glucosyltransferase [Ktedonobacterales bacterium]
MPDADCESTRADAADALGMDAADALDHQPAFSIVIPAYNEALRLPASLDHLRDYVASRPTPTEVIVVDDGSDDTTAELVERHIAGWPGLGLRLLREPHRGKGGAIHAGVLAARGAYIALADADFSMPADEFDCFGVTAGDAYDVAIASRTAPGATRSGEPPNRRIMGATFSLVVRALLVPGIRDTQCGFKVLRREAALDFCAHQTIEGWCFDVELLHIARLRGYRVREVPIAWHFVPGSRVHPLRDAASVLRDLLVIRLRSWRGRYGGHIQTASEPIEDQRQPASSLPSARVP